ncbi:hypothetical protein ON010_g11009 [Phytophthora cinnamomi]|nr:hypothetical protein ON010_g11009 [Phytophthora cinnamomi]
MPGCSDARYAPDESPQSQDATPTGVGDLRDCTASSGFPSSCSGSDESKFESRDVPKSTATQGEPDHERQQGVRGDEHVNYEESDPEDGGGQERQCQCAYLSQVKVRIRSTSEAKTVTAIRIFASDLVPTMVTFLLFK